ncbi:MAG: hypothetical protein Q4F06_08100 [Eubacteriales bacterium]|nr:hypothetical protein [Eubacteriales bacterium]
MRFKKFAAFAVSSIMMAGMCFPVFAADLNSNESSIISTLQSSGVPAQYVTQARNYFLLDDVDITSDQAASINSHIQQAKAYAGDTLQLSNLSATQQSQIVGELSAAGNVIGLGVTYNSSSKTLLVTNGRNIVFESVAGTITSPVVSSSSGGTTNNSTTNNNTTNNNTTNNYYNTTNGSTTSSDGVVKKTGTNMYLTYGIVGALAIVLAGCGVVVYRKNSYKKEV